MKASLKLITACALTLGFLGCQTVEQSSAPEPQTIGVKPPAPQTFAWPFLESEEMVPRGGTTRGSPVALVDQPSDSWKSLQEPEIDKFEKDRRAILAMAGDYRTGFQFVETGGFTDNYSPAKPYFSWGTEHVFVLEDSGEFISLQHILVMYIVNDDGETTGPLVMKHWRQDWTYEKTDLHTFRGNRTWKRLRLDEKDVSGKWVQSVFQVDDSPRYEVLGSWNHGGQYSSWLSETSMRPLPRREHSVRDDYNILEGEHRITISPTGWVHEQHNRKVSRSENIDTYVAQEIGFTRYELITAPDLSPATDSWQKVGDYWRSVRETWKNIYATQDTFQLRARVDDKALWQFHFAHAAEIEKVDGENLTDWSKAAASTIESFLIQGDGKQTPSGY